MMNKDEFIEKIEELTDYDDFRKDGELLIMVPAEQYSNFTNAIIAGYKIRSVFTSLGLISELAVALNLEGNEVIRAVGQFRQLYRKLMGNSEVSDPIADATEIMDDCNSYQALIFLREHLEFRITTLLENLKPTSQAFSESWLKKRCPACGFENHIYNGTCSTCGWEPSSSTT